MNKEFNEFKSRQLQSRLSLADVHSMNGIPITDFTDLFIDKTIGEFEVFVSNN